MKTLKVLKINLLVICMFVLFSLFTTGEAIATTYYVSPSGNDSNSGLIDAPFKTIQRAANTVVAGDTVIVKDGVYTDTDGNGQIITILRGGTSSNWITFKSENKWGAVLDGQSNTTGEGIVLSTGAGYVNIEDFEIKGLESSGLFVGGTANHITFKGNKIHDIGRKQFPCDPVPGISNYAKSGSSGANTTSYLIYDSNIFYNIGRIPLGDLCVPANCGSCPYPSKDYATDHAIYIRGEYTTVVNNIFYSNTAGWSVQIVGSYFDIINNTFHGANGDPNRYGQIILDGNHASITIQNNISYGSTNSFINTWYSSGSYVTIKNNLIYGAVNTATNIGSNFTISGNIIGQDPKFVDLANRNFHLQSGSPAINAGLPYSGSNSDADGKSIAGLPDIGAYEYSSAPTADTTPPSVPTALTATSVSSTQINLSWVASTDNVGVTGYKVYRDGSLLSTVNSPQLTYQDTGLSPSITYTYTVSAYDNAGNISAQSAQASATTNSASVVYLSDLSWISATNGYGPVEKDKSNGDTAAGDGKTITLNGTTYAKGLGVHAASDVQYNLAGKYSTFMADAGVDDEMGSYGSVVFQVFADGVKLYDSGTMTGSTPTKQANVDITGKNTLQLVVANAGDGITSDHADWADARLAVAPLPDTTPPAAPTLN